MDNDYGALVEEEVEGNKTADYRVKGIKLRSIRQDGERNMERWEEEWGRDQSK